MPPSADAREFLAGAGLDLAAVASQVDGKFMSAFVRARKPANPNYSKTVFFRDWRP